MRLIQLESFQEDWASLIGFYLVVVVIRGDGGGGDSGVWSRLSSFGVGMVVMMPFGLSLVMTFIPLFLY